MKAESHSIPEACPNASSTGHLVQIETSPTHLAEEPHAALNSSGYGRSRAQRRATVTIAEITGLPFRPIGNRFAALHPPTAVEEDDHTALGEVAEQFKQKYQESIRVQKASV